MEKQQILDMAAAYCRERHTAKEWKPGDRIRYAGRVYDEEELCNLVDASLDFWLTAGKYTEEFEAGLGKYLGVPYCSVVNSGSSANLLAMTALTSPLLKDKRILPGDEVITVAAAFPTTVAPIIQCGALPVFVDIEVPYYNIDAAKLEEAFSPRTKAVFLAHSLGNVFDLQAVKAFCKKHELYLIEDNCDALGAEYEIDGEYRKSGTIGDIGASSFYPAHHMTMGEGGAVYTRNPLLHRIVRSLRDWGRDCICSGGQDNRCGHRFDGQYGTLPKGYDHKYVYSHLGYNLKVTDMQAAIGAAQLKKLPGFVERRRENWEYLKEQLGDLTEAFVLPEITPHSRPSWFGFMLMVRENAGKTRDEVIAYLESCGIQTRALFAGNITRHPCFETLEEGKDYRICGGLKETDEVMHRGFWVGVYPGMTREMLDEMVRRIRESVKP